MQAKSPLNLGISDVARNSEMGAKRYPSGRVACRRKLALQTKTCPTGAFLVSTATR